MLETIKIYNNMEAKINNTRINVGAHSCAGVRSDEEAYIAGIATESVVDGPGIRSTVFFQGCPHACLGCHNPDTWDPAAGRAVTLAKLLGLLEITPLITGVTFSGGEPFLQATFAAELGQILKEAGMNIWIYTGFTWEYLLSHQECSGFKQLLEVADVLVDGPFIQKLKVLNLPFRGSSNQRIIDIPRSLRSDTLVEWSSPQFMEMMSIK